ncbi:hypothetical protein [Subtercola vilae]|uniref:Uncharacterized protein n=1 Tax=Subtercola vilae TaxID=2056433 RepID=A0A4T2BDL6_9MICO|nr:hypothetical protein [Subtercola vilae]TIH28599.1 hypothetical protein D4765_18390 [Subtercola vilae]
MMVKDSLSLGFHRIEDLDRLDRCRGQPPLRLPEFEIAGASIVGSSSGSVNSLTGRLRLVFGHVVGETPRRIIHS